MANWTFTTPYVLEGPSGGHRLFYFAKLRKGITIIKLDGEYGIDDCYLGVPVILGKNGIEKVIELALNPEEQQLLETSRGHVKEVMQVLDRLSN